uniref:Variant surface glycoprotein 1125.1178 n=1 Tax=Trypanosoma brucei TaxID=5691 RepID=A0A1J0R6J2_9TRYP|nr:variant surface glycoprotein 1125.1178 [Trypanosoma brucei]
MYSTLTIALLTLAQLRQVTPTPDHHKNVADLQVLCDLMNLAKGSIDTPTVEPIPETVLDDIERLNISLADPKWRSTLAATAQDKQKKDSEDCKTPGDKEVCKPHYRRWDDHNIAVLEDTKGQKFPKISNDKLESTLGRSVAITVSGLTAKAQAIKDSFNDMIANPKAPTISKAKNLLAAAVYGAPNAAAAADKSCQIALANTRQAACGLPNGATAVCETLICVRAQDGTQQKQICGSTASPDTQQTAWSTAEKANKWNPIKSVCDAADAPTLTAHYVRHTLAAALNRVQHCGQAGGEALVIGTPHSDCTCHGQDAEACINLDSMQYKSNTKPTGTITWATFIAKAADTLQELEQLEAKKQEAVAAIEHITTEARQTANALQHSSLVLTPLLKQQPQQSPVAQKEDCEAITQPDQCRSKGECEWNDNATGEEKKCKLNTTKVAEQAKQAGTGERATSGADPNCSQ